MTPEAYEELVREEYPDARVDRERYARKLSQRVRADRIAYPFVCDHEWLPFAERSSWEKCSRCWHYRKART